MAGKYRKSVRDKSPQRRIVTKNADAKVKNFPPLRLCGDIPYNICVNDPLTLRQTFNAAAQEYDAIRPGYPEALIDDVIALSGISEGGRALEIGCGTGQATLPFARRGLRMLCLDIGPDLLEIAAQNLRDYPNVRFKNISFERWSAQVGKFDLVFSATAFHWVPREIGYPKAALALRPGGALAVFSNEHPRTFDDFHLEVQEVYRGYAPEWGDPKDRQPTEVEIRQKADYIDSTGLFELPVTVRTYQWKKIYTTTEYLRLLNTYSDHRMLEEGRRRSLYQGIAELIERRYSGKIEKTYLAVLFLGKKP